MFFKLKPGKIMKLKKLNKKQIKGIAFTSIGALLLLSPLICQHVVYPSYDFVTQTYTDSKLQKSDNRKMNQIRGQKPSNDLFKNHNLYSKRTNLIYAKQTATPQNYFVQPLPSRRDLTHLNYFNVTDKVHLLSLDHKHAAYINYDPSNNHCLLSRYNDRLQQAFRQNNLPIYNSHLRLAASFANHDALSNVEKSNFHHDSYRAAYLDKSNAFTGHHMHFYYPLAENLLIRDDSIKRINGNKIPVIVSYNPNYELANIFRRQRHALWNSNKHINQFWVDNIKTPVKQRNSYFNYNYAPYNKLVNGSWARDVFESSDGYKVVKYA